MSNEVVRCECDDCDEAASETRRDDDGRIWNLCEGHAGRVDDLCAEMRMRADDDVECDR